MFDIALGLGCGCCNPFAAELPDIVCHQCKKVLYTTRNSGAQSEAAAAGAPTPGEFDMTPRS